MDPPPPYEYYAYDPEWHCRPFDATALGFAGNPGFDSAPEDIAVYAQPSWTDWIGAAAAPIVAPAPVYPEPPYFAAKEPLLRSPPAQLPTPAAMATLLSPHVHRRSDGEAAQSGYGIAPGSAVVAAHLAGPPSAAVPPRCAADPAVSTQGVPESLSREKKHACTMCHKRFDRPSTLRKHLLVHTGEKAFVCDTCGRRFGVASNLNRHVKRCILKPVNTPSPNSHAASPAAPDPADAPMDPRRSAKRGRTTAAASSSSAHTSPASSSSSGGAPADGSAPSAARPKPAVQPKRRRRAPSPSQWVPATLQSFNLLSEDALRVTAVPLPPVRRCPPREERDSWDENVGHCPYHPCGWSGVLPGPGLAHGLGLGGKDVRNVNLGGRGGHMLGRVLVF